MESLGRILLEHTDSVIKRWLAIVNEESLGRRGLSEAALKDALPLQLRVIGEALQTGSEKADELWTNDPSRLDPEDRVLQQVPIEEVVAEYSYAVDAIHRWVYERGIEIPFEEFRAGRDRARKVGRPPRRAGQAVRVLERAPIALARLCSLEPLRGS